MTKEEVLQSDIKEWGDHWCKGKIVDRDHRKYLLRCNICGRIFEGDTGHSIGPFTKAGLNKEHGRCS